MNEKRLRFPRQYRVGGSAEFAAVFEARVKQSRGVIVVHGQRNGLGHSRLGISIGRRHGNAVRRNLIKRRMREAFRLNQYELPQGYDLVVTFKVHEPVSVSEYGKMLREAAWGVGKKG